jgi:hypothetical protein
MTGVLSGWNHIRARIAPREYDPTLPPRFFDKSGGHKKAGAFL